MSYEYPQVIDILLDSASYLVEGGVLILESSGLVSLDFYVQLLKHKELLK
jgi:hypothetical protein